MRRPPSLRTIIAVAATALVVAAMPSPGTTAPAVAASRARVDALAPTVIRAGLRAGASVIRRGPGFTVERLQLSHRVRAALTDPGSDVYRVTVQGRFPPRALRYVLLADGRPVAYATPARLQHAAVAITSEDAVLRGELDAVYEGGTTPAVDTVRVPPTAAGLATSGPFDVTVTSYDLGDRAYQPAGLGARVEIRAAVYHPADLAAGPFPVVLFLHGNHSTCYRGDRASYEWPCRPGWRPIPNHEGYAYLGAQLASDGYVVVSVSGNGVNVHGNTVDDTGMRQRGLLLERHLVLLESWSTTDGGPLGTSFAGALDMDRIGVMGHSRGGEGAVMQVLVDRERPDPFGIDAVLPLAPVDFRRETINDVPLGVILPACDGDVFDLQGVHFFDDSRYTAPGDATPKSVMTAFGANHNFFNTVWSPSSGYPGAFDDGYGCGERLTERRQRLIGAMYMTAFFRQHVGGEDDPRNLWSDGSPPGRLGSSLTAVSYLAPDDPGWRLDIDRFDDPSGLTVTEPGGAVAPTGMGLWGWCANTEYATCVPGDLSWFDIHASFSFGGPRFPGLGEGVLGWDDGSFGTGSVRFEFPASDVAALDHLTFRTVPNPGYYWNEFYELQDMSVVIEDASGARATVAAADAGNDALTNPLRAGPDGIEGKVIMQQMRFDLTAFDGVDLSSLVAVEFVFDRTPLGVINVSDLAFQRAGA